MGGVQTGNVKIALCCSHSLPMIIYYATESENEATLLLDKDPVIALGIPLLFARPYFSYTGLLQG